MKEQNGRVKLNIGTLITLIVLTSSIVGTHYMGIAQSREYTDIKVEKTESELRQDQNDLKEEVIKMQVDMATVRQILVNAYGEPKKCNPNIEVCPK